LEKIFFFLNNKQKMTSIFSSDRAELGQILVEACASESSQGDLMLTTTWQENIALTSSLVLVSDTRINSPDMTQVEEHLMNGFLPVSVCGFKERVDFYLFNRPSIQGSTTSKYLVVFIRPLSVPPQGMGRPLARVKLGQDLKNFLQQDRVLARQGLTAHKLNVHLDAQGQVGI
jgi:hypothetical protein